MTPATLALVAASAVLLVSFVLTRSLVANVRWRLHEVLLFWQTLNWIGAIVVAITAPTADATTALVIGTLSQISLTAGALVATAIVVRPVDAPSALSRGEERVAYPLALAAATVCLVFSVAVLRNEELGLLLAGVLTGDESFNQYRVTMYSGGAVYLAPGYVKQFRDVLLPSALLALVAYAHKPRWLLLTPLALIGFIAAVLSGERFVMMIFFIVMGAAFYLRSGPGLVRAGITVVAGALVFSAFIAMTILLQRASGEGSLIGLIAEAAGGLFDRVAVATPRATSDTFWAWSPMAPQWGASWVSAIAGVLPGAQVGIDNDLHEILGGSALGTAPLGMPADAYLAWGLVGVVVFPFLYCVVLALLDQVLLDRRSGLLYAFRVVLVPLTFAWYSPFLFMLNGGAVLLMCSMGAALLPRRR